VRVENRLTVHGRVTVRECVALRVLAIDASRKKKRVLIESRVGREEPTNRWYEEGDRQLFHLDVMV
jgi:hypothetical protein